MIKNQQVDTALWLNAARISSAILQSQQSLPSST